MPAFSDRLGRVQVANTTQMTNKARALREAGHNVIQMTIGEPDFATPRNAIDAAYKAALDGETKYPPQDGTRRLKEAVQRKFKRDRGLDFLVEIDTDDPLSTQLFVVQVKGTTSSDPNDWMPDVKPLFRGRGSSVSLPVCVFVVDVRENKASYAWVAEPQVDAKGATLRFHETGIFHPLDPVAVSDIIDRVKTWYEALPNQLMPA